MGCEKEAKIQREEEREDLKDIARSENEGFGIISSGYCRKKDKKTDGSGLASKK